MMPSDTPVTGFPLHAVDLAHLRFKLFSVALQHLAGMSKAQIPEEASCAADL